MKNPTENRLLNLAESNVRGILVRAGIFSVFVNLLMLTGPLYMLQIYDRVLSSGSIETLLVLTILTVGLYATMSALDFIRGALLARAGATFENRLREATFNASMVAATASGASPERPLRDLRQIRQFVGSPALTAVFDAPVTPLFMGMIFLMHPILGIVAVSGLIILLALSIVNERWSRNANETAQKITQEADELASSTLRNATSTDAMGMRKVLRDRWVTSSDSAIAASLIANDRIGGLTAATKATRLFLQSAILGTGAYLAVQQEVTPGVMIAASIITGRALAPIEVVTSQWRSYAMAGAAYQRLRKFLETIGVDSTKTELPMIQGRVSASKAFIQPATASKPILRNISFQLQSGIVLGIIGPSGAGKSTLARALVGVERIVSGEIRIDEASLEHWDRDILGQQVGYLPQDIELFSGTVAENIARFRTDATSDLVLTAATAAGAHEVILSLPDGYETQIGNFGRLLSSGQRQRIGLARALYDTPTLVVLDEPNANLDADGDAALVRAIQSLKGRGATTIVVAHRPSGIALVDKLLMLDKGEIRAFGDRDEVLKKIAPGLVASQPAQGTPGQESTQKNG